MVKKKNGRKVNLSVKPKLSLDVNRGDRKSGTQSTATQDEKSLRRELEDSILKWPWNDPRVGLRLKRKSLSYLIDLEKGLKYVDLEKEFVVYGSRVRVVMHNGSKVKSKFPHKSANKSQGAFEPFKDAFGSKGRAKRPKLLADNYESLLDKANKSQDAYEEIAASSPFVNGRRPFRKSS
ncbi:hypothetical protein MKW98_008930 [Papaver atlanticum]|uniref:Uncharacterized protein n=1 Tax=Papaver atlanticum TaxID=357466 RepID=A0AAD4X416_9MAGN|nr:hypothetical protein MKW98_008930 [Papaver atlanticum]